jgi:hypothetical protein
VTAWKHFTRPRGRLAGSSSSSRSRPAARSKATANDRGWPNKPVERCQYRTAHDATTPPPCDKDPPTAVRTGVCARGFGPSGVK